MYDVVAIGELLVDFACRSTDDDGYPVLAAHPGGAPANFLAVLARYGLKTALLAKVGNDAFGRLLRRTMEREGIDLFTSAADTIARDGHIANKIGTFQIAILAKYFGIPYYVTGIPIDLVRALATFLFLWLTAEPLLQKLDRIKTKYALAE